MLFTVPDFYGDCGHLGFSWRAKSGGVPNAARESPRDGYSFRSLYKTKMAAIDRKIWDSDQYR